MAISDGTPHDYHVVTTTYIVLRGGLLLINKRLKVMLRVTTVQSNGAMGIWFRKYCI